VKLILRAALVLAVLALLFLLFHAPILTALGSYLVKAGPPEKADVIVVLAGDGFGRRVLKAAELAKEGYASKVLVSGPDGNYGNFECDLAIPFAVKAGYPESMFVHLEHRSRSTTEEIRVIQAKMHEMGAKRILVVTSTFHTRRAGKLFHRVAPEFEVIVVASEDEYFRPDNWWKDRQAQKIFLLEWMKTVAEY
jgi:uncharacterized SAM-binding protein YcdF (DUF218 family)